MKLTFFIFFLFITFSTRAEECVKNEYQEMKEWTDDLLISKFCENKKFHDFHIANLNFWDLAAKTDVAMRNNKGAAESWKKVSQISNSAKICSNELERILRLLVQRNKDEATVLSSCTKS